MESQDSKFDVRSSKIWRETLEEGLKEFVDIKPGFQEKSLDSLSKEKNNVADKYEMTEANWVKTFKSLTVSPISNNKLVYYPSEECVYKILSFKKEGDKTFSEVKMIKHPEGKELTLTRESDIDTLRDFVYVNILINSTDSANETISVQIKLQNKFETEVEETICGATKKNIGMFKFFRDGDNFDKDKFLSSLKNVKDGMEIMATASFGKPSVFKRFPKPYEYPYWGYYGGTTDAIAFVPSQNVIFCGFTIYTTDQPSFEWKYKIYIDDNVVEERDKFTVSEYEDKLYYRIKLDGFYEVKAGSKLEVTAMFSKNFDTNDYISTYYGDTGDRWKEVDNEHNGLWTVEYSQKSGSTSVGYGNFPEIMYYV